MVINVEEKMANINDTLDRKKIIVSVFAIFFVSCSTQEIQNSESTFTELYNNTLWYNDSILNLAESYVVFGDAIYHQYAQIENNQFNLALVDYWDGNINNCDYLGIEELKFENHTKQFTWGTEVFEIITNNPDSLLLRVINYDTSDVVLNYYREYIYTVESLQNVIYLNLFLKNYSDGSIVEQGLSGKWVQTEEWTFDEIRNLQCDPVK